MSHLERLTPELHMMIIDHIASFDERPIAQAAIQSLRWTNTYWKLLLESTVSPTKQKIEALQRYPQAQSRSDAAYFDYVHGMLPRRACQAHGVKCQETIDEMVRWAADMEFATEKTTTAEEIVERFEMTNLADIQELRGKGAERDIDNGARVLEAISSNKLSSNLPESVDKYDIVSLILLRGARKDRQRGLSTSVAIANNEVTGIYEMGKIYTDQFRLQGAQLDVSAGMTPEQAANHHGMDNDAHREYIGATRLEILRSD